MNARFKFLSGARAGAVELFRKAYIGVGRHPLSDVRFDAERDLDVSSRHAAILRHGDGFVVRDLGSKNGTFLNGRQITGDDAPLNDGDIIGFGPTGPSVEFHIVGSGDEAIPEPARASAERMAAARAPFQAVSPAPPLPARASSALRIAQEVARQTRQLRQTTKLLIGLLLVAGAWLGWTQWQATRDARDVANLQARADSLNREAQRLLSRFQTELQSLRDALRQSQVEVSRLKGALGTAGSRGDAGTVARLREELEAAEARQRGLAGAAAVDYRTISRRNQDAVALIIVKLSDTELFSGTAFAVDSAGTLVTNKHVLTGDDGTRQPQEIAVKFSGSKQWFRARFAGASAEADIGVVRIDIRGGTPRVLGFAADPRGLQRGDPVAIIGYPLGEDLPMERQGQSAIADPTLTVGTVSKVLSNVVQVDGYGAPGSSGSPIFDREGRVVAVLYGGERESQGKIIYAVPAAFVVEYLRKGR